MPPKLPLPPQERVFFPLFKIAPTMRAIARAGPKGISTKGVSMKRSNFLIFRAFYTAISKEIFRNRSDHGCPIFVETLLVLAEFLRGN